MTQRKCPRGEELVAYQDGALSPARLAEIDAHLCGCYDCRQWLRESDEIGRMLRAHVPLVDDPEGLARLKERLRNQPPPARTSSVPRLTMPYRLLAASLAVLVIVGSSLIWSDELEGGSSFTRWWRDDDTPNRVVQADRVQQTPATAPETVIAPPGLPFGLALTEGSTTNAASSGEWFYRNTEGLAVRVTVDPPGDGWLSPSDGHSQQIMTFNGRELMVIYGHNQDTVLTIVWTEDESLHTISVVEQPLGGLPLDDALTIVTALMDDE
jgi:hypothetical protein